MKQQDQAVRVQDPLVLAEYFEALIGTSSYVMSIAQARQGLSERVDASEVLQTSVDRQALCSCHRPRSLNLASEAGACSLHASPVMHGHL